MINKKKVIYGLTVVFIAGGIVINQIGQSVRKATQNDEQKVQKLKATLVTDNHNFKKGVEVSEKTNQLKIQNEVISFFKVYTTWDSAKVYANRKANIKKLAIVSDNLLADQHVFPLMTENDRISIEQQGLSSEFERAVFFPDGDKDSATGTVIVKSRVKGSNGTDDGQLVVQKYSVKFNETQEILQSLSYQGEVNNSLIS
jgi:hypothetical protein